MKNVIWVLLLISLPVFGNSVFSNNCYVELNFDGDLTLNDKQTIEDELSLKGYHVTNPFAYSGDKTKSSIDKPTLQIFLKSKSDWINAEILSTNNAEAYIKTQDGINETLRVNRYYSPQYLARGYLKSSKVRRILRRLPNCIGDLELRSESPVLFPQDIDKDCSQK